MATSTMQFTEFLLRALAEPIGLCVRATSADRLRQRLYTARRESNNPALDDLAICLSRQAPATEVWIIKKTRSPSA